MLELLSNGDSVSLCALRQSVDTLLNLLQSLTDADDCVAQLVDVMQYFLAVHTSTVIPVRVMIMIRVVHVVMGLFELV